MTGQQPGTISGKKSILSSIFPTNTWQDTVIVYEDTSVVLSLPAYTKVKNDLYIYFTKTSKVFGKYNNSNIYYVRSVDEGTTWGTPVRVTYYPGVEGNLNLNSQSLKPYIVFSSDRKYYSRVQNIYPGRTELNLKDNSTPQSFTTIN
ncbi:MAG: hypothetical protein IPJ75_03830 [Ignavibacteriales bacterium]|nr:hypothetical protein [Ignavibacteriales bacterium]